MAETTEQASDIVEAWLKQEDAIDPQKAPRLQELLDRVPLQDLIAVVERQNAIRAALALRLLPRQKSIAVFDALDAKHQADIIDELGNSDVYEFFDELDPEDRVALLDELPAEIADRLLRSLTQSKRDVTGVVLGYDKGSVGRRMSPEVPVIHPEMSVKDALFKLRETANELETIYTVPITREDRRLVGVVSLREIFTADAALAMADIMHDPIFARAGADAEETARWFLPLDMLALPVVDESCLLYTSPSPRDS